MAAFVAEDEEDFVVGDAAGGGVPHNDALGGAKAGDVGVEAVGLEAGLHQEHAAGRNVGSGTGDDLLQLGDQSGMIFGEGFKFVEDGIEQRRHKDGEHQERERDDPGAQPVTARPAADDPIEEQQHGSAHQQDEAQRLGLVAQPTAPTLHADAVAAADVLAEDIQGQAGQGRDDQQGGEEEQPLQPAAVQKTLCPASQTGGGAGGQQQPQNGHCPESVDNVENVADAAEGDGFGQLVWRQGIGLRGGLSGG